MRDFLLTGKGYTKNQRMRWEGKEETKVRAMRTLKICSWLVGQAAKVRIGHGN